MAEENNLKSIYDYDHYKIYLNDALPVSGKQRGARSQLAQLLQCQTGFISQVLKGQAHFSLEHGIKISKFLGHSGEEADFFLNLIHLSRSGSVELTQFYEKKIAEIRQQRLEIKDRIKARNDMNDLDQMIYYSQWFFSAIHILTSIPRFQSKDEIKKILGLSVERVHFILDFLVNAGLVVEDQGRYKISKVRVHLDKSSPSLAKHHTNWRLQAIRSLENMNDQNLHYSAVLSLSKNDFAKVKELILRLIEQSEKILLPSPEEELVCFNADFFVMTS